MSIVYRHFGRSANFSEVIASHGERNFKKWHLVNYIRENSAYEGVQGAAIPSAQPFY